MVTPPAGPAPHSGSRRLLRLRSAAWRLLLAALLFAAAPPVPADDPAPAPGPAPVPTPPADPVPAPDPAAVPAPAPGVDLTYTGRFKDDPRFLAVLRDASAARARAVARVAARLALPAFTDDGAVLLRFRDALDLSERFLKVSAGTRFTTGSERIAGAERIVITGMAEFLVAGGVSLERELVHEMTHALMRCRMGAAFRPLPPWLREGIALWVAEQGPERVRYYLGHGDYIEDPTLLLNGLEGAHELRDYPEDWLALDYLESRRGVAGVQRFAALLLDGRPWPEALAEVAGEDWPAFAVGARAHARAALVRLADPALPDYRRLALQGRAATTPELAQAMLFAAEAFGHAHPESAHARAALYLEGKFLRLLNHPHEARARLARVAAFGAEPCGLEDDALYQMGMIDWDFSAWPDAAESFGRLVNEHPASLLLGPACYRWGLALHRSRRLGEARRILEKALATWPEDPLSRDARDAIRR